MKTKRYPNYVTKNWQYRPWLLIGFSLACYFMVQVLGGANEAFIGVIGFSLMTARLIVMRSRYSKQKKQLAGSEK